jgi:hypothetical protein
MSKWYMCISVLHVIYRAFELYGKWRIFHLYSAKDGMDQSSMTKRLSDREALYLRSIYMDYQITIEQRPR